MQHVNRHISATLSALMLLPLVAVGAEPATAQTPDEASSVENRNDSALPGRNTRPNVLQAQAQVESARRVVEQIKRDPRATELLARSHGVFIVPTLGEAAAIIGGRGGEGVLLVNDGGKWVGPAFFNFGRISAGLQAGGAVGAVAMVLMSANAVSRFTAQEADFTLDATAGLTLVDYSKTAAADLEKADVVMWSDTKGLFAGASIGVTAIARDAAENMAYYGHAATPQEIFSGVVATEQAAGLREALPTQMASR